MLFRYLDHLRTKPKEARQRVAFVGALVLTLLLGGVWSLTLPARFANTGEIVSTEGTKPFAGFVNGLKSQWGTLRNQASTIAATVSTTTATSSNMIDVAALLDATSTPLAPVPMPILIGTTSASTSSTTSE